MSNNIYIDFWLNNSFDLKEYKKMLRSIYKNNFDESKIRIDKKIAHYYACSIHDEKEKVSLTYFWDYKIKKLHVSLPDFDINHVYGTNLIHQIYTNIKNSIKLNAFGNDSGSHEKELELFGSYVADKLLIWSANLFPPSEVQKYGREKLLNAPCEVIEEWEDGAIFMMIHKDRFSSTYEERKKLREYLGEKPIGKKIEEPAKIEKMEKVIPEIKKPKTSYKIFVLQNSKKIPATIRKDYKNKKLVLKFENKKYENKFDANWFRTLRVLDNLVDKGGYRILCNGTSKHCGVMGFIATMADGSECYYMDPNAGKDEKKMKTIDTLEYSSWNEYVAEEEQRISFFGKKFVDFMKLDSAEISRLMKKWRSESDNAKEVKDEDNQ